MIRTVHGILAGIGLLGSAGASFAQPGHDHHAAPANKPAALICPVMKGKISDPAKAPHLMVNNAPVYFCCAGCDANFKKDPAKYLTAAVKDPVTGKAFKVTAKTPKVEHHGALFLFASDQTKASFLKDPAGYAKPHHG
jgi:YHS domain-containing protein